MVDPGDQLADVCGRWLGFIGVLLVCFAAGWAWPLETTGAILQVLGILFTMLGVAVVPGWLADFERWLTRHRARIDSAMEAQRTRLADWWARRRGGPASARISGTGEAKLIRDLSLTAEGARVDRMEIGTPEWLAYLEQRVGGLAERVNAIESQASEARSEFERHLTALDETLRAHTISVATRGWQFIIGGLFCSLVGTVLTLIG